MSTPLADALPADLVLPLDVSVPGQLEAVFDTVAKEWGRLDILVHSIAFAPKEDLQGGLLDCSARGCARPWTSPVTRSYEWRNWRPRS